MKRLLSVAIALLTACVCLAEDFPVPRRACSASDSVSIAEIRDRMERIRERRPSVALVLSGGGAKGAAHIGVIKYLESIDMPVDLVLGTSMGGLMGGLYSLGYNAHQMDSIIRCVDWNCTMTDKLLREYISYSEMKYKEKYLLNIPFYYSKDKIASGNETEFEFAEEKEVKPKFRLAADSDAGDVLRENLLGSLPSGFSKGQAVFNIITSLSVGYQDSLEFSRLPIPFMCVATDLVDGNGVYMYSGKLATAMRSTMSIPGVFAPVKVDGMVLVDGGMRDNYPVSVARELGADIVIGVDLGDEKRRYDQINNIADIAWQSIDMLGMPSYLHNVPLADVNIRPVLTGYNMMSFDNESIDVILSRGYEAAVANSEKLLELKERVGTDTRRLNAPEAVDINLRPVMIDGIEIRGVPDREMAILMGRIKVKSGDMVCRKDVEDIVGQIYGTKAYEYVTYELEGTGEPYHLVVNCRKGPVHRFGLGLRADTEEIVSVLMNLGFNSRKLYGSTYDFTGKISANPYMRFQYSYDGVGMPTFNLSASARWVNLDLLEGLGITPSSYHLKYFDTVQEFSMSNIQWSLFDIKGGFRNRYFMIRSLMSQDFIVGNYNFKDVNNDFMSLFLNMGADTFDNGYFPSHGFSANLSYEWVFHGYPNRINNFHVVSGDAKVVLPAGRIFAFIPSVSFRFLLGADNIPIAYMNIAGGSMPGRYFEQQMAFVGKNNVAAMRNILTMIRTDFRFEAARHHYVTGIFNYARDCDDFRGYAGRESGWFGAGVEYAYDAFFGPVKVDLHWSNITNKVGFYIGIGYNF
ncbi:MAG: patatin-like phospholipase family protein [Bacteroidales bacterium]|nr:patatin-like phospholipase family protein [Bacteroidales bacterium]